MPVNREMRNYKDLLNFRVLLLVYLSILICWTVGANQAHAQVLLDDDFENPTASSWNIGSKPGIRIVLDKAKAHSGNGVLEMQYDPNTTGPGFHVASIPPVDEFYHRWYQKWSANWVWSGVATKMVKEQAFVKSDVGGSINVANFVPWATGYLRIGIEIGGEDPPGATGGGHEMNRGSVRFDNDRWYCIEVRAKMNTPGKNDGILQAWINDTLVIEYTNELWRGPTPDSPVSSTHKFEGVMISGFYNMGGNTPNGVPNLQFSWHDDHVVSTRRVGCLPNVADETAPSPPSGLQIIGQ